MFCGLPNRVNETLLGVDSVARYVVDMTPAEHKALSWPWQPTIDATYTVAGQNRPLMGLLNGALQALRAINVFGGFCALALWLATLLGDHIMDGATLVFALTLLGIGASSWAALYFLERRDRY